LAVRGEGDTVYFPGLRGKLTMAWALLCGDLAALRLAPRILRKRRAVNRLRRLPAGAVRRLILANRLSLRETV
jgi:hypothetical protein